MIYGIDISNYQGNISDLGSDIDFCIIKVTEGTSYVSPYWQEQRDTARRDGKIVIYYHFLDNVSNAVAEAQHFLATFGGSIPAGEGYALDWEVGGYSDAVDAGCAAFFNTCNHVGLLYSNAARINSGSWPRVLALHEPLWEAAYSSSPPSPSPFPVIAIWQYTSSGSEQGVSGAVDKDEFNGTRDQLLTVIGGVMDVFNEGDRQNVNIALYGYDKGFFKTTVGRNWKDSMYAIFQSADFKNENTINSGDVSNINSVLGGDASGELGKIWKDVAYNYILKNANGSYVPVTTQLYEKK